jgi:hypothetical protein
MVDFTAPVDIANRALQHCGAKRIATPDFSEISRNCSEVSFCYDKLRKAELQSRYWSFAIKRTILRSVDANTMILVPSLWMPTTTYFVGQIVADRQGTLWESLIPNNLGNDPLLTTFWQPYCGPLGVPIWDSTGTTSYFTGELVYTTPGDGTNRVYRSLIDSNSDDPASPTDWDATVTYSKDQVVTFNSVAYMSLIDLNLDNEPDLAPALWSGTATYAAGAKVGGSDGMIYQSIGSGNIGNDPVTDGGTHWTNTGILNPWTTSFVGGSGSVNWLQIGGAEFPSGVTLRSPNKLYPMEIGPATQFTARHLYVLPGNYLRKAPQNPKKGIPYLGGPSGVAYDDFLIEGKFLSTGNKGPLVFRFVADITDVTKMHSMFCEGVAMRIGIEVCEILTQSGPKLQTIAAAYKKWMTEAGTVDAIEDGFVDPPDDDYISVRF